MGEKKEVVKVPTTHKITMILGSFCEAKAEHSMDAHSVSKQHVFTETQNNIGLSYLVKTLGQSRSH